MALLERVSTLIRANLNDLIEKAENPEKILKQIVLDMENQLMQVKTQVAISMADQHLLQKKQTPPQPPGPCSPLAVSSTGCVELPWALSVPRT